MLDGGTYTNNDPNDSLSVDELLEAWEALEAKLPRLRYHTSIYVQPLGKDGEPFVIQLPPSDIWPEDTGGLLVTHPDNLPYLKRMCRGRYRLEPLPMTREPVGNPIASGNES